MMNYTRTILAAFGHPDDEVWGTGGTLAHYSASGVRVALVSATRGEVGEIADPSLANPETLAVVREEELRCSCRELGVKDLFFLGYRDSGMAGTEDNHHPLAFCNASMDEAVGKMVMLIRQLKPQVLITFDRNGAYGHPDHIRIHEVTTEAFLKAGDSTRYREHFADGLQPHSPQHLYYTALPRSFFRSLLARIQELGIDMGSTEQIDIDNFGTPDEEISAAVEVGNFAEAKIRAFSCHRTQLAQGNMFSRLPEAVKAGFMEREYFVEHGSAGTGSVKTDLFS